MLIVDDFGVEHMRKVHREFLLRESRKYCTKVTEDWTDSLYVDITLDWNYTDKWVDISIPGFENPLDSNLSISSGFQVLETYSLD